MSPILPPLDGSLPTLPDVADFCAKHNPDHPWFLFPSKDAPDGIQSILFAQMTEASHRVAHLLRPGREGIEGEVIALLLNTDSVLYTVTLLGLMRAGFIVSNML